MTPAIAKPVAAQQEMKRVLDTTPASAARLERRGVVVQTWQHGALHASTRAMTDHVFMTYRGAARRIERRGDGAVQSSLTREDSVTLIPAGAEFRWDIDGPLHATHVYVTTRRLRDLADAAELPSLPGLAARTASNDPLGAELIRGLSSGASGPDRLSSLWLDTAADLLCLHLLRAHAGGASLAPQGPRGGLAPWQLKRVTDYLEAHLCDDVALDDLAALIGTSTWHLCRAFKASTGAPPHRWRQRLRIERAQRLLVNSDLSVADIGAAVGYDDPSLFAAAFRKIVGAAPSRYRREQR